MAKKASTEEYDILIIGSSTQSSSLPNHVYDYPAAFPELPLIQSQLQGFRASQTATEQQSDHCRVSSAALVE
jgi:hypothetical protein